MGDFRWTDKGPLMDKAERIVERAMLEIWRDARWACPVDTGNLANSIIPEGPNRVGSTVTGSVGTNVKYALFVEVGTQHMAAQPYLGPALEKARRKYGR